MRSTPFQLLAGKVLSVRAALLILDGSAGGSSLDEAYVFTSVLSRSVRSEGNGN